MPANPFAMGVYFSTAVHFVNKPRKAEMCQASPGPAVACSDFLEFGFLLQLFIAKIFLVIDYEVEMPNN